MKNPCFTTLLSHLHLPKTASHGEDEIFCLSWIEKVVVVSTGTWYIIYKNQTMLVFLFKKKKKKLYLLMHFPRVLKSLPFSFFIPFSSFELIAQRFDSVF